MTALIASLVYNGFICIGVAIFTYMTYYLVKAVKKPIFICKNANLRAFIRANMPILSQRYWPTFWCFPGHCQTLIQGIFNEFRYIDLNATIPYRKEIIETSDGGEISLDWVDNDDPGNPYDIMERPTVVIFPGMAGSSDESYIRLMVNAASDLDYRVAVFNQRGLGGVKLKTPRTFAMTDPEDYRTAITHIKSLYPLAPLIAEGFSAGAVTLFHYMEHFGDDCHLIGAMLVSVLFDGLESTRSIEKFPARQLFNRPLSNSLIQDLVKPNEEVLRQHGNIDLDYILESKTMREFHARFTVPLFGFNDWRQFYKEASLNGKLHKVKVPTLILNAADDPFSPYKSIPMEEIAQEDNIMLALTRHGGHNGFLQGLIPTGNSYDVQVFSQFISALFRQKDFHQTFCKTHEVNSNRID